MALQQLLCGLTVVISLLSTGCQSQTSEPVCGIASKNSRIVGGQDASPGSWPWLVSLSRQGSHFCGGSLIDNQWVLTASHCIDWFEKKINVFLGRHRLTESNANEVSRTVTDIICHHSYNILNFDNDVCLLKLSTPVNFTDYISPVCLASADSTFHTGTPSWVAGWGDTLDNRSSNVLQEVQVPIVGPSECRCLLGHEVTENMICAGFRAGGKDACQGDSGGAMVSKGSSRWIQSGVVSFGYGCAEPNSPGGYTRVSKYQAWISNVTGLTDVFVTFTSPGNDSDKNFTCTTPPPVTTTTMPTTTINTTTATTKVTKCKSGSLFDSGESVMHVSHFTHFASLCVLILSLYVLVGDA